MISKEFHPLAYLIASHPPFGISNDGDKEGSLQLHNSTVEHITYILGLEGLLILGVSGTITGHGHLEAHKMLTWFIFVNPVMTTANLK
jgi:hypothetical protein